MAANCQACETGAQLLQEAQAGTAVGTRFGRCSRHAIMVVGAIACIVLLGSGAWFASSRQPANSATMAMSAGTGVAVPHEAMRRSIMQASHFMQSCSSQCNRKLDEELKTCEVGDRGCPKTAHHKHGQCCSDCNGGKCTWPCSEACNQDYAKALVKCTPGVMDCKKPAAHAHKQCCLKCPLAKCTPAKPTEDDFKLANATVS